MELPREWTSCTIKDIQSVEVQNGFSPQCVEYETARKSLSLGALTGFSLDLTQEKYISEKAELPLNSMLHKNDILVSRSNTKDKVGRAAVVLEDVVEYYYPDLMMRFQVDSQKADCRYVAMYLQSPMGRNYFMSHAAGTSTSMVKINKNVLESFPMVLPPLAEQKKIAETLSVWDFAIEKMEKLIQSKNDLLAEYGSQLFGKKNCVRRGWENVCLSSVLIEHGNKSTGNEKVFSVSVHKGLVDQVEHLGRSFAAANTSNYNMAHYGDVIYTKSPTGNFPLGIVKQSLVKEDVIVSPLYGVFTPKTFELGVILDFYFSSATNANNYLHPIAQKGAKNTINITNKTFLSAKLTLPLDPVEQRKIADFIQTAKEEMSVLQDILENYKKQKQGLMQKLLTGEWRVK